MGISYEKNSTLPTPTKLTSSVEAKENRFASPNSANQMKSSAKKNFMSPTISASSKVVSQRKKILGEKNGSEATEPTCAKFHHRRSSSFDLKQASVNTSVDASVDDYAAAGSLCSKVKETSSVEDGEDGTKLKPYDPVLNYCSPRPKFLLYKPDRRSEILRRYEMIDSTSSESETGSENEECLVKQNEENTENEECLVKQTEENTENDECLVKQTEENTENDECLVKQTEENTENEEFLVKQVEENTENAGKSVDNADHIVTLKPDEEGGESIMEAEEKIEGLGEEVPKKIEELEDAHENVEQLHEEILEHVQEAEAVKHLGNQPVLGSTELQHETNEAEREALQTEEDNDKRIQPVEIEDEGNEDGECDEEYEVEKPSSFKRFLKLWFVIFVLGLSTLYASSMNTDSNGLKDDHWEVHSGLHGAPSMHKNASESVIGGELAKMGFEEAISVIMDIYGEHRHDIVETTDGFDEVKCEGIYSKDLDGAVYDEVIGVSTADQIEATLHEIVSASNENVIEDVQDVGVGETPSEDAGFIIENSSSPAEDTVPEVTQNEYHVIINELVDLQSEASDALSGAMDVLADDTTVTTVEETASLEDSTGEDLTLGDWEENTRSVKQSVVDDETLTDMDEDEVSEVVSNPVMVNDGLMKRYVEVNDKIFAVVSALLLAFLGVLGFKKLKRSTRYLKEEAGVAEQDANRGRHSVKVDTLGDASCSNLGAEDFKSGVGAPRVELLGELNVGEQEVSSYSLRTSYLDNHNDSTYSSYQRNMKKISFSQPAVSGFSSTTESPPGHSSQRRSSRKELPTSSIDSPSYGSFTTEMMFLKKEEARGKEQIIVTPVRRSSRIHSRLTPGVSQ